MQYLEDFLATDSDYEIPYRGWTVNNPKAQLVISHGMAEHSGRYEWVAHLLNQQGYSVWALDHRGHGEHWDEQDLGVLPKPFSWQQWIEDLDRFRVFVRDYEPNQPHFLVGHGLGAYLALGSCQPNQVPVDGLILSGASAQPRLQLLMGHILGKLELVFHPSDATGSRIAKYVYNNHNHYFSPNRTPVDWLNRDPSMVDDYLQDPFCGFDCSYGMWATILSGLFHQSHPQHMARMPKDLPVLLLTGTKDPATFFAQGTERLLKKLKQARMNQVNMKVYGGAYHELFADPAREVILQDMLDWIAPITA